MYARGICDNVFIVIYVQKRYSISLLQSLLRVWARTIADELPAFQQLAEPGVWGFVI